MDRGNLRNEEKKYLSIVVIPHSTGNIRMFKFSSLSAKLAFIFASLTISLTLTGIFIFSTIQKNQQLNNKVGELYSISVEQQKLLKEKADEINTLKQQQENVDELKLKFADKLRDITDNYISGRISNRSGDRNERSFANEISELKIILAQLDKINRSGDGIPIDLSETENKLKKYLDSIPTLWPAPGDVNDNFGYRIHPVTGRKTFHEGIDIDADYGENIVAAASGTVIFSGQKSGYGNAVIISHGNGVDTLYGHSSKLLVKVGQKVNKGDVIAIVGSTGVSTGPHLHFEVLVNNTPVDPLTYVEK